MKKTLCAIAALLSIAGCATPPDRIVETASGKPEGVFRATTTEVVSNRLVGGCAGAPGAYVSQATPNRVECRGQMQGGEAVLAQMVIGNSYSTPPEYVLSLTLVQQGSDVRVYGETSIETIMAFGQPRRLPITNNNVLNETQKMLWRAGAEQPKGA